MLIIVYSSLQSFETYPVDTFICACIILTVRELNKTLSRATGARLAKMLPRGQVPEKLMTGILVLGIPAMYNVAMEDNSPRYLVESSCSKFLKNAIAAAKVHFGQDTIPLRDVEVRIMEPIGVASWLGKRFTHQDIDTRTLYDFGSQLKSTKSFTNAVSAIESYIDVHDIQPIGPQFQDTEAYIDTQYITPLFLSYVKKARRFAYRKRLADKLTKELLDFLDDPAPDFTALVVLEGFTADRAFQLDPNIEIHPISRDELIKLGRSDSNIGIGLGREEYIPHTDWWICKMTFPNKRGTSEGSYKIIDATEMLTLTFRAFRQGGLSIGCVTRRVASPFGTMGETRGGLLNRISIGAVGYSLTAAEITSFKRFWKNFRRIMEKEHHYLQIPIRRLRAAGTRVEKEDTLVDCVVGLEALLGTDDEKTEIGYRFRIRGAVLLATRKNERGSHIRYLRELYDLRSRLVHGQTISKAHLDLALPKAENALRTVWRWYFARYADEKDNRRGIEEIDKRIVSD